MTARLAPALTGPSTPTAPAGTGRRPAPATGDEFSALLGAAGDRSAPVTARPERPEAPRRSVPDARPEPRQEARPLEERRAADRRAAERRDADDRRADERRQAERRPDARRAADEDRGARRDSVERRGNEDAADRADRAARSSERRVDAQDARDAREQGAGEGDEQAQQGGGEAAAESRQGVEPAGDAACAPVAGQPVAPAADAALLALLGGAPDAPAQPGAVLAGTADAEMTGLAPSLAAAPLPSPSVVPQPAAGESEAPGAVLPADLAAPAVAPATLAAAAPTQASEGQGDPAGHATSTMDTPAGAVDVTVLDGATPLPQDPGSGAGAQGDAQQGATGVPSGGLAQAAEDVATPGVEGSDTTVAAPAGPAGVPAPRAEAALGALGRPEATARPDAVAEAAVERADLGPTVADLARAAHRDGSGATRVVIRLDPPELGTVTVAVTVRGGDVRVTLLADAGVVPVLDSRREDVHRALADAGLALGGYDVSSGSQQGQERQQEARDRAALAGRPWRALGPEMDFERAAAVDRAARGVWL